MTKPILLIEDDPEWGDLICHSLRQRGFRVDWFVRAHIARRRIQLTDAEGRLLNHLYPETYSIALINGRLRGSMVKGWELVPILRDCRLKVIATSGHDRDNELMMQAGASEVIPFFELWEKIITDQFHLFELPAARSQT